MHMVITIRKEVATEQQAQNIYDTAWNKLKDIEDITVQGSFGGTLINPPPDPE